MANGKPSKASLDELRENRVIALPQLPSLEWGSVPWNRANGAAVSRRRGRRKGVFEALAKLERGGTEWDNGGNYRLRTKPIYRGARLLLSLRQPRFHLERDL